MDMQGVALSEGYPSRNAFLIAEYGQHDLLPFRPDKPKHRVPVQEGWR
jgi:hypothetical protein